METINHFGGVRDVEATRQVSLSLSARRPVGLFGALATQLLVTVFEIIVP